VNSGCAAGVADGTNPEITVADDKPKWDRRGVKFISLEQGWEVDYWTRTFGVSRGRLAEAVTAVGYSAEKVSTYLEEDAVVHGQVFDDHRPAGRTIYSIPDRRPPRGRQGRVLDQEIRDQETTAL
jgi:uncharacterized protein DUF3606